MKSAQTLLLGLPILVLAILVAVGVRSTRAEAPQSEGSQTAATAKTDSSATATFAGGCFWCMEPPFEKLPGVVSVTSGYTGGKEKNPSYQEVSSGKTGHVESVQVQ
ncbi:MAG: peptide-methionine (S)-S-oxide reductase, partial [Myxococcales bacterium]